MEQRMNFYEKAPRAMKALFGLSGYLHRCSVEQSLLELVYYRVSQINGCAYCLDMHSKDRRVKGESEQRLYVLSAWREAPFYTDRERAAFAWAEAVTKITERGVPDKVYEEALNQFTEEELGDLTLAVIAINGYNRINVAFKVEAGNYEPGQHAVPVS